MTIRTQVSQVGPIGLLAISCLGVLAGCATQPLGPTVDVLPGPNQPFEVFQGDQAACKQYADQQVAGQVDSANQHGVGEAVVTTILGAGLGAAIGGGHGAAVGAAAGGLVGADVGANSSGRADSRIQHQYNQAYSQCMYSKGDQVVGYRTRVYAARPPAYYPAPGYGPPPPPPPPGYAPPPPQGYAQPPAPPPPSQGNPSQSYPEQPYPEQQYPSQ